MICVYILKSLKDEGYYIGITKDINKRLKSHNTGKNFSTKARRPFILVYKEPFPSYNEARVREIEIKSYKGGVLFKKLTA